MKYIALILLVFVFGCTHTENTKASHSFYYWKTSFEKSDNTAAFIKNENVDHFYIHYFDVSWDLNRDMPVPVAEIQDFENAAPFIQSNITPVVFITNNCLNRMDDNWCDSLAHKISDKIVYLTNRLNEINPGIKNKIDELQIDCDWTADNKEKYFRLLKTFKQLNKDKILSVTIRLYPYKYPDKTGIPPADKGLLMCYNLTDIRNADNPNSIFNYPDLERYLNAKKYPLPLDIALPIFRWYAHFTDGKFYNIIYPEKNQSLPGDETFLNTANNIVIKTDTVIGNNYIRAGDMLRAEVPSKEDLERAANLLHKKFPSTKRISFFYWDDFLIKENESVIHKVYNSF